MRSKQIVVSLTLLMCMVFVCGCNNGAGKSGKAPRPRIKEVARTPADKRKAELLKQIDRKFENPDAHFELGQLYHADSLWSQAEYEYNTALNFNPVHREAQAGMVKLMIDSGDTNKSKLLADIYMKQSGTSAEGSLRLGLAFQGQGLDDYALTCYKQAINLAPNSAKITRQIGYYYLSKNDKVLAKEYLIRSFQLDHNQPEVAGELGRLGVEVRIPQKSVTNTKKLDKVVEQSGKKTK